MVHYFIKLDSEEDLKELRVAQIGKFMRKNGVQGNNVVHLRVSEYDTEIDKVSEPLEWSSIGNRDKNDYDLLCTSINEWTNSEYSVFFVSSNEMSRLIYNYVGLEDQNSYNLLTFSYVENRWSHEGFELFDDVYNTEVSLTENLLFIFRSLFMPELAYLSERNRVGKEKIKKKCLKLVNKAKEIHGVHKKFIQNVEIDKDGDDEIGIKAQNVTRKMINIENVADENISKCNDIIDGLRHTENQKNFNCEKLILFPTKFSVHQIELKEALLNNHCDHEFTLKNNTTFYWKNLVIYIEINGKRLLEISELKPNETLILKTDYDFDLINEKGKYEIQLFYGSQTVSKKVTVARILILSFVSKDNKIWTISMKNNGVKIEAQIKITRVTDRSEKTLTTTIQNFKENNISATNLIIGEFYEIQVFCNGVAISEKIVEKA